MVPAVVGGPGSVVSGGLQLEVLVEVGRRLTGHLLQAARPELIARPSVSRLLLLPENTEKVRSEAESDSFTPVLPPMLGRYESSISSRELGYIHCGGNNGIYSPPLYCPLMQGIVEMKALPLLARTRENH